MIALLFLKKIVVSVRPEMVDLDSGRDRSDFAAADRARVDLSEDC
jgi:hypothetical protein